MVYRGRGGGGYHKKKKKRGRGGYGYRQPEGDILKRIRMPGEGEVLGVVLAMMGGSRMRVSCKDGKERMCRIPGKLRNRIWVKENDIVIVRPYQIEGDTKGDIIWRYNPIQAKALREQGEADF